MANYINIGSTCANFDYESGLKPTASLTGLYLINGSSGMPLKDTPAPTVSQTSGFLAVTSYTGGSNAFNIADTEFKVWFNEGLSRFASGRQDWRYLTDPTASAPVYNDTAETSSLRYQTVVTAGGSVWPTQSTIDSGSSFEAGIQVTHPAVGGSNYYLVNSSNVFMYTYANTNIVTLPSPISYTTPAASTTISMDSTQFYLYNKSNDIRYITYSGTAFGISDTNTVTAVQPTAFYMTRVRSGSRIFMALATGTPGSGTVVSPTSDGVAVLSNFEVQITSATTGVAGTYRITTVNPSLGESPAGFPDTTSTLLKHVATGRYLYWTGTGINNSITVPTVFDLRDFWSSGLNANQIIQGMQFKFQDMTGTSNAAAAGSGTLLDWYHWKVVNDVTKSPSVTNNTSNVAVTRFGSNAWVLGSPTGQFFGNQSTSTDVHPSKFEGWSIYGTSGASSNALVYVRVPQAGGLPTPVGYLTVSGGNLSFVQSSTLPNLTIGGNQNANSWVCYKCTTASGQYCSPYSTGGSSAPVTLGTITSVTLSTDSQLSITIGGSGLSPGNPIYFRILLAGNPISIAAGAPTSWAAAGTFNVTATSPFIVNSTYTIEFNSTVALVNPTTTSTNFRIPYYADSGLITMSVTMYAFNFAYDYNDNRLFAIQPSNLGASIIDVISLNSPYTVSTYLGVAGTAVNSTTSTTVTDGTGSSIVFRNLQDIALQDFNTTAYFIDAGRVRSLTHPTAGSGAVCTTIAGSGAQVNTIVSGDGTGTAVTFGDIRHISTNSTSSVFVTDTQTSTLKRIYVAGVGAGTVQTIVGGPFANTQFGTPGSTDGTGNLLSTPATSTGRLYRPNGLACAGSDLIYICDSDNHAIRLFNMVTNQLTTVAGSLGVSGNIDGAVGTSRLTTPLRITYARAVDSLYFIDGASASMIKRLDLSTNTVTTVINSGSIFGRFKNIVYIDRPGTSKGRFVISTFSSAGAARTYLLTFL